MQVVALEQEKRALEQKVDRLDSNLSSLDSVLSKFIQEQQQKEQVVLIVLASCLRMKCQGTSFSTKLFFFFAKCKSCKFGISTKVAHSPALNLSNVQSRFIREISNVPRFLYKIGRKFYNFRDK
jgi:hypothetical protein